VIIGKENDSVSFSEFEVVLDFNLTSALTVFDDIVRNFDKCGNFSTDDVEVILSETEDGTKVEMDFGGDLVLNGEFKSELRDYFRPGKHRMVVLYQDSEFLPTFGGKAKDVLIDNLTLDFIGSGIKYKDCTESAEFMDSGEIDDKDIVVITGNLQYQIGLDIIAGCNVFNEPGKGNGRREKLKNWVRDGGRLWINDVGKYESNGFSWSYFEDLGYSGGSRADLVEDESLHREIILERARVRATVVEDEDFVSPGHQLLNCPHKIEEDILGTWVDDSLKVTSTDEIILGDENDAILWVNWDIGDGVIVFDEFLLRDNLYESIDRYDDLYSTGLVEEYYENVLTYLLKPELKDSR